MPAPHQHLRRILAGGLIEGRRPRWAHALSLMKAVTAEHTPESAAVLREVATFDGHLLLDEEAGLPHAMAPEDMLRSIAAQTLARWDHRRHRAVIRSAARSADTTLVAGILRRWT